MESVSCHQKGLVMGNILWSVDKKIYSDKEDHTLAITGWAITRDQSECDFILYGKCRIHSKDTGNYKTCRRT